MKTTTHSSRYLSILILIGLVLSQFALQSPVQAAAAPTISFGSATYATYPGEKVTLNFTESVPTNSYPANNAVDILFTLNSHGTDIGGLTLLAYTNGGSLIGQLTLTSGQTSFWGSAFGGALSRRPAKKLSNTSTTFQFSLQPDLNYAGLNLDIAGKVVISANKYFSNANKWTAQSDPNLTNLKVYALPQISSADIGGPYKITASTPQLFTLQVSNPTGGKDYTDLVVHYTFSSADAVALNFDYRMSSTDAWTAVDQANGIIGPAAGFALPVGQTQTIYLEIKFKNSGNFPISLSLTSSSLSLSTWNAVMAVDPLAPAVISDDITGPYNAGQIQPFSVTVINDSADKNYPKVVLNIALLGMPVADIASLEYYAAGTWQPISGAQNGSDALWSYGAPDLFQSMTCPCVVNIPFRVNFAVAGTYSIKLSANSNSGDLFYTTYDNILVKPASPDLTLPDIGNSTYVAGTTGDAFSVLASNPSTGKAYTIVSLSYAITGASASDITSMEYLSGTTWYAFSPALSGSLTLLPSQFQPGQNLTNSFRVNFANAGTYTITFTLTADAVVLTRSAVIDVAPAGSIPVTGGSALFLPFVSN